MLSLRRPNLQNIETADVGRSWQLWYDGVKVGHILRLKPLPKFRGRIWWWTTPFLLEVSFNLPFRKAGRARTLGRAAQDARAMLRRARAELGEDVWWWWVAQRAERQRENAELQTVDQETLDRLFERQRSHGILIEAPPTFTSELAQLWDLAAPSRNIGHGE